MKFNTGCAVALVLLLAFSALFLSTDAVRSEQADDAAAHVVDVAERAEDSEGLSQALASLEDMVARGITLEDLQQKLPYDGSAQSRKIRRQLFNQADGNGNGVLSLAEIDELVRQVLGIGRIGPSGIAPVLMRAYQVARNYGKGKDMTKVVGMKAAKDLRDASLSASTVDRREFRILLEYLHKYFKIYESFKAIDTSFDGRIDQSEFAAAKARGLVAADVRFSEVDDNGGGHILFDEFAAFAIARGGLSADEE